MKRSSAYGKLSAKEICLLALMGALIFVLELVLAALPNIHVGAVLIMLTASLFGWKVLYSVAVYVLLEGLYFGFGLWWLSYLYTWPLLAAVTVLLRKHESLILWAAIAGIFGLSFGALCSLPYFFIGGPSMALSYWISGIPFDLMHCIGNLFMVFALYKPLKKALNNTLGKLIY